MNLLNFKKEKINMVDSHILVFGKSKIGDSVIIIGRNNNGVFNDTLLNEKICKTNKLADLDGNVLLKFLKQGRAFNIRIVIIVKNINRLKRQYGDETAQAILNNCLIASNI